MVEAGELIFTGDGRKDRSPFIGALSRACLT
jgi:hypothetical protein